MRRRPYGSAGTLSTGNAMLRVGTMLCCLLILGMIYTHARNPQTWRWLVSDGNADTDIEPATRADKENPEPVKETIVPGPTDDDPEESKIAQPQFDILTDKAPLAPIEMPAYWRAMRWSQAQSFDDMSRRAREDVRYSQLWEQSEEYRGDLIKLRLHIRLVTVHDAPENSSGVSKVYEAWGWTRDSKSFPYILVFSELPPGMKVGDEVSEEGMFVGYFLKTMLYTTFDANRAAPLLVGRMRHVASSAVPRTNTDGANSFWTIAAWGVGALLLVTIAMRLMKPRRGSAASISPSHEADLEGWLRNQSDDAAAAQDPNPPANNGR
jgi:hypothetical protein